MCSCDEFFQKLGDQSEPLNHYITILLSCRVVSNLSSLRFISLNYFRIFHCGLPLESDLVDKNSALEVGMMESVIVIYNVLRCEA